MDFAGAPRIVGLLRNLWCAPLGEASPAVRASPPHHGRCSVLPSGVDGGVGYACLAYAGRIHPSR